MKKLVMMSPVPSRPVYPAGRDGMGRVFSKDHGIVPTLLTSRLFPLHYLSSPRLASPHLTTSPSGHAELDSPLSRVGAALSSTGLAVIHGGLSKAIAMPQLRAPTSFLRVADR